MSFEVELRERLQREAASVPLPGRDPRIAASRAKTIRHRRQLTAAGMVALSAAVILGAPLLLADQAGDKNEASVLSGPGFGLPETGPIELDWQTSTDGLSYPSLSFQDADGVVYAISTAPGRMRPGQDLAPRALYRLGEDGTWEPVLVDDEGNQLADLVAGDEGVLYSIGTAPAAGGDGVAANLATSGDGGATWTTNFQVDPPAAPSDVIGWDSYTDVGIETNGSTTLAAVTTSFYPQFEELFPELNGPDADSLVVELRPEGAVLTRYDLAAAEAEAIAEVEATRVEAGVDPGADGGSVVLPPFEDPVPVRTVPWAELGVDGHQAMVTTKLFVRAGDGWQEVTASEVAGASASSLTTAAGRFVAVSYSQADGLQQTVATSEDGVTWTTIDPPIDGEVVGIGDALVNVAWVDGAVDGTGTDQLSVSTDAGVTWTGLDLAEIGVAPGMSIYESRSGPLGLALLVGPADMSTGPQQLLFTGDLVDWTVTDLADLVGLPDTADAEVFVGENQVVVTAADVTMPARSATAVGTPIR